MALSKTRTMTKRSGDKELDLEKLAILRREICIGLKAAAAGQFSRKTVREIADDVRREYFGK
jgi:antitoxin ParD1/3/4